MINTQLKFVAKIPNKGLKVVAFPKKYTKFLHFKTSLTLKVKVKVISFKPIQDILNINKQFKCKGKISNGSIKNLKQIFGILNFTFTLKVKSMFFIMCLRSLVVRALEWYSKDPGSSTGGDTCFSLQ